MDFRLTDEQTVIRETIRKFAAQECPRELAHELDARARLPRELLGQIAELGFCGLNVSETYGGAGRNVLGAGIVIEELATLAPTLAGLYGNITLRGASALALGSAEQKRAWLPGLARGDKLIAWALEESRDARMIAVDDANSFALNGTHKFVAFAAQADCIVTRAQMNGAATLFLVDANADGLRLREIKQLGFRGAGLYESAFDNVRVTRDAALGGATWIGRGAEQLAQLAPLAQIQQAALALGIAQGAYEYAAQYARERVQFCKPLVEFEPVQHFLVNMAIELRAARWLLYHAGWLADENAPFALEAAIAQVQAVSLARHAALNGLHILGGYGYMMEYDAQRYVRDALSMLDGVEPVEVQKNEIGELLGLENH